MAGPVSRTLVIMMDVKGTAARAEAIAKACGGGDAPVVAPRKVTIGIPRARFTAIMGPSGSGKSMPLRRPIRSAAAGRVDQKS
jgi:ABC-type transporter Mla maintaining outer membrane lipid asymmetry ATPase subunit MlaF